MTLAAHFFEDFRKGFQVRERAFNRQSSPADDMNHFNSKSVQSCPVRHFILFLIPTKGKTRLSFIFVPSMNILNCTTFSINLDTCKCWSRQIVLTADASILGFCFAPACNKLSTIYVLLSAAVRFLVFKHILTTQNPQVHALLIAYCLQNILSKSLLSLISNHGTMPAFEIKAEILSRLWCMNKILSRQQQCILKNDHQYNISWDHASGWCVSQGDILKKS